jgi:hypothetical protein
MPILDTIWLYTTMIVIIKHQTLHDAINDDSELLSMSGNYLVGFFSKFSMTMCHIHGEDKANLHHVMLHFTV